MNNNTLINPYDLFNLTSKSTLKQLQKKYYKMALICHPDKGGTDGDMIIIHKAYSYIKEQLENCKNTKKYEEIENEFADFCNNQKKEIPLFREIWELSDDKKKHDMFNIEFNKKFKQEDTDIKNPFLDGYGELMDKSEYSNDILNQNKLVKNKLSKISKKSIQIPSKNTKHNFKQDIIVYDEPHALPDRHGEYQSLKVKKINDFSSENGADYLKSFCEPEKINYKIKERTFDDILKEREEMII